MENTKVQSLVGCLDISGLTDKDLDELANWYSYFTNRRLKGNYSGGFYVLGSPIIDKKARKKGLMLFGNILSKLDDFELHLNVESFESDYEDLCFKCINKNGEKLVVVFSIGDSIDFSTCISVIGHDSVKLAKIMLDKRIIFDKLSYYDAETREPSEYYSEIYNSVYKNLTKVKL